MVMEKKWIKDLGANECIHAPTQEISDKLCKKFDELGLKWSDGGSYVEDDCFSNHGVEINYVPFKGIFLFSVYTNSHYKVYTINDLLDFDGEQQSDKGYTKEEIELLYKFAGLAMQGICVNAGRNGYRIDKPEKISMDSYSIAKSMLRAINEDLNNG